MIILKTCQETKKKKALEHESDGDTNCNGCVRNNPQRFGKQTGKFGNRMTSEDHPDNSLKISQKSEKNY